MADKLYSKDMYRDCKVNVIRPHGTGFYRFSAEPEKNPEKMDCGLETGELATHKKQQDVS